MSAAPRRCPGCGAESPRPEARFCESCGAALAPPAPVVVAPPVDPLGDVPARFRALAAQPELAALLAATPDVPELAGKTLPSVLLLVAFAVVGVFVSLFVFQLCPPFGLIPLALVGAGVLTVGRKLAWNVRAPLTARPALVVSVRAQLAAGAEHSPAHTRHFVTLQDERGARGEHECFPSAVAELREGVMGVAYLKGERLCAFTRLPV